MPGVLTFFIRFLFKSFLTFTFFLLFPPLRQEPTAAAAAGSDDPDDGNNNGNGNDPRSTLTAEGEQENVDEANEATVEDGDDDSVASSISSFSLKSYDVDETPEPPQHVFEPLPEYESGDPDFPEPFQPPAGPMFLFNFHLNATTGVISSTSTISRNANPLLPEPPTVPQADSHLQHLAGGQHDDDPINEPGSSSAAPTPPAVPSPTPPAVPSPTGGPFTIHLSMPAVGKCVATQVTAQTTVLDLKEEAAKYYPMKTVNMRIHYKDNQLYCHYNMGELRAKENHTFLVLDTLQGSGKKSGQERRFEAKARTEVQITLTFPDSFALKPKTFKTESSHTLRTLRITMNKCEQKPWSKDLFKEKVEGKTIELLCEDGELPTEATS